MNKIFYASGLVLLMASSSVCADGFLRIKCDDKDIGAEVYINGKFVGNCPVDAPVRAGIIELRARKTVDQDYEKLFEKHLQVVEGVPQRVEVTLSAPQLTTEGRIKAQAAEADTRLRAAEAGEVDAMNKVADYYDAGIGVTKDTAKANAWRVKAETATAKIQLHAAEQGNIEAMEGMAARYDSGRGVNKDPTQASAWRTKAEAAKREEIAQAEVRKRESLARKKAQEKQERIARISFFETTSKIVNNSGIDNDNVTSIITTGVPLMLTGFMADAISAPTKTTELNKIKNQAAFRPSIWGKPDSMIARAARQHEMDAVATEAGAVVVAAK